MPTLDPLLERILRAPDSDSPVRALPSIDLDIAAEPFLVDHQVLGHPLLPTVMATDMLVWAALGEGGPAPGNVWAALGETGAGPLEIRDLTISAPVRFDSGPRRRLDLRTAPDGSGGRVRAELHSADPRAAGRAHFSATVSRLPVPAPRPRGGPPEGESRLPLTAADIYPPYFHGPLLQVIDRARVDPDGVVARLSCVPALSWSARPTVSAPTLLELCLQACGLWELARTGRMMIPSRVDTVVVHMPESRLGPLLPTALASVRARKGATGDRVFDGHVADAGGTVLLEVRGYHTVPLPTSEHTS